MKREDPLTTVKGVGDVLAKKFSSLGIETIGELVEYYPRKYDDYTQITDVVRIKPGIVTIRAVVKQVTGKYVRRGLHVTEAVASDVTGSVRLVWFNQPYRLNSLQSGKEYYIRGNFGLHYKHLSIQSPSVELISDFPLQSARIVQTYSATKGLTSLQIQKIVRQVFSELLVLPETLPQWLVDTYKLMGRDQAVRQIHLPDSIEYLGKAKRRIAFEEVFALMLSALYNKLAIHQASAPVIPFNEDTARQFAKSLPFELTESQKKAAWQIYLDLQKKEPMNRLLEGDVGSGKTVVAVMAGLMVMLANMQVVLMAPTELLARQHAETVYRMLEPLGHTEKICLLVGGMTAKQKSYAKQSIASGKAGFIIGTHALLQRSIQMKSLGLVIVDEQHRFGVAQRKKLLYQAGYMPHLLSMTATPIPRSLALTLYGEMDIALLETKPLDRKPIKTTIISPNSIQPMYRAINEQLKLGKRVYVVSPVIDSSTTSATAAVHTYQQYKKVFSNNRVGLLHGRLVAAEKESIMKDFVEGKVQILVTTTVVEVGVDVPDATVIVINDAERFGLAQIHQLRGRVGRSDSQSYCFLVPSDSKPPGRRLRALETSQDGFKLAELDLEIRGPGAIYGTTQHGALDLRVAQLTDVRLISEVRQAAQAFIDHGESLLQYTELHKKVSALQSVNHLN